MMWREAGAKVGAKANWNLSDDRGREKIGAPKLAERIVTEAGGIAKLGVALWASSLRFTIHVQCVDHNQHFARHPVGGPDFDQ
jgi:hypothetical protein